MIRKVFLPNFENLEVQFDEILNKFKVEGELIGGEKRNIIKVFYLADGTQVNIKSFKKPNIFNSIVYRFFRKSKAQRSFEYAQILISNKIDTPQPFAFYENKTVFGLKDSYYFSLQQDVDLTFRNLILDPDYPNKNEIIRQTAQFFFNVHNKGIELIDNTPGNTIIKEVSNSNYKFYLVDLNRMNFHENLSFDQRMKNLAKLTFDKSIVTALATEYAKLIKINTDDCVTNLLTESELFVNRFNRRKKIKKKLKFWKK